MLLTMPQHPFAAVLFDCDGVLVDSEPITNGLLREMLEELGWVLTPRECMHLFLGKAVRDERAIIEKNTGRRLTDEWLAGFRARRDERLRREVRPIEGALDAVAAIHKAFDGRIAVASGADRFKIDLQLARCGLGLFFEGRVFSGHELPRSKPFPDVYLAAAAALGIAPRHCAVVEDTVTGVKAGIAAGATVFGYSSPETGHDGAHALRDEGAVAIFTHMGQLPALLTSARPSNRC